MKKLEEIFLTIVTIDIDISDREVSYKKCYIKEVHKKNDCISSILSKKDKRV